MDERQQQDSSLPAQDLPALMAALRLPSAYPERPASPVEVVQTHASLVLLAGKYAYKLKKARDFGFFDYTTPALRRHFCIQETLLNARLAPDVYLGVAPVLARPDGSVIFGETVTIADVPVPGAVLPDGRVIDYAVVMRRLPEEATLAARLARNDVGVERVRQVARLVAAFHARARTDAEVARFGDVQTIAANWEENFAQMRPYIGRALSQRTLSRIETYARAFMDERAPLLRARVTYGRIRDCHGDLRSKHVYVFDDDPGAGDPSADDDRADGIIIVDCIEFNDRFRFSDVAAEVAFLAMELDAAGRYDLSYAFVDAYITASGDDGLREVLPFYCCYRACVRGKVTAFQLDQPEIADSQREAAQQQARLFFDLAATYATNRTRQALVLIGGLMGTGKSTLANALHHDAGFALVASDAVRKQLANIDRAHPIPAAYGAGIYSEEWSRRTYAALLHAAREALGAGRSVILDASFARRRDRLDALALARDAGAQAYFIEARCSREVTLARLASRWSARTSGQARDASDGRPALYDQQAAAWEPFAAREESGLSHSIIATDSMIAAARARLLESLGLHEPVCWLDETVP